MNSESHQFPPKAVDASVDYEGLLVELASLDKGDTTELALALGAYDVPSASPPGAAVPAVKIVVSRGDETLTISADSWLGKAVSMPAQRSGSPVWIAWARPL